MKNWVSHLLTVQNLDMRLAALETKYRTIPIEKERLKEEYRAAGEKVISFTANVHKWENLIKEKEAEAGELEAKIKKIQIQSATAKKNSEYQALMNEIASTHAKISDIESVQIDAIDKLEAAKSALADAEAEKKTAERVAKSELQDLAETAEQIKVEALEVKKKRSQFVPMCDSAVMEIYMKLREKNRLQKWLVPLTDGSCGNCALRSTPQTINNVKKGQVVCCDNCGCILYDPSVPADGLE